MHFTSEVFVDNGEPAKFKLILKYFFFGANIILIEENSLIAHLNFTAFIFVM